MEHESITSTGIEAEEYDGLAMSVENIGGIDQCDIHISPEVTILKGRNATNRSSLLRSISDVLGGEQAALKSDADYGKIELSVNGEKYTREYYRKDSGFVAEGEQFTNQHELIDLFVRILEDNPIRLAVERGDDLRELLMEPVDTDEIEREVRQLENRRSTIDDEIQEIQRQRKNLSSLEDRRLDYKERRQEIAEKIQDVEAEINDYEASQEEAEKAQELLEQLEEQRKQLQSVQTDIDRQEDRLEKLQENQSELQEELEEISVPSDEIDALKSQLQQDKQEKRALDTTISELQQIIRFNENIIENNDTDLPGATQGQELTSELDPSSVEVECWTCGTTVQRESVESRIGELRRIVEKYRDDRMEIESNIRELEERVNELGQSANEKTRLENQLQQTNEEFEVREEKLEKAKQRKQAIQQEIEEIESQVENTEELRESNLADAYKQLSKLEYDRGRIEQQLTKIENNIQDIEDREVDLDDLKDEREDIAEQIKELRTRIGDLETHAVEQFNEHMDVLLEILNFENIARIWIERVESDARVKKESSFELNIVRETSDGSVYNDTIETLSESERKVIGLVVALTGYLTHEVYESAPVMLLDSLEAIDAGRLDSLIGYFSEYVPFLIVALLPEDAAELSDDYERITADELTA